MAKRMQLVVGEKSVKVTMYSGGDDPDLPNHVLKLPLTMRARWVNNYNWAVHDTMDNKRAVEQADAYTTMSITDLMEAGVFKSVVGAESVVSSAAPTPEMVIQQAETAVPAVQRPGFFERFKAWLQEDGLSKERGSSQDNIVDFPVQPTSPASGGAGVVPSLFTVYKSGGEGGSGALRVLLTYSNNFFDKQSQTISAAAHKEYAEAAEAGKALYPDLHLWHGGPATKWGTVETVSVVDGFAVAGGVVDAGKEDVAYKLKELADKGEIAVSFGYYGLLGPDGTYNLYRPFEISPLQAGSEANPWFTGVDVVGAVGTKENGMAFSDKKKAWFKTHFKMDDAAIADAEKKFGGMAEALKAAGIPFKEDEAAETPAPPDPAPVPPPPTAVAGGDSAEQIMMRQVANMAEAVNGLAVGMKSLQDELKGHKATDAATVQARADEIVAARITGAGAGHSPAAAAGTVVPGLKDDGEDNWLDKALGGVLVLPQVGGPVIGHANGEGVK